MAAENTSKFRVVVLISGRGSNLQAIVECSAHPDCPYEVVGVLSDKSAAGGLEFAESRGIPRTHVPRRANEQSKSEFNSALADAAKQYSPDLVVLAGFMRILSAEFISQFPNRIINIHPSLLPAFPGLDVQQQALDAGVRYSGCTVHFVSEKVDAGAIIAQGVVPVLPRDNADSLAARILRREHQLYPLAISAIARGQIRLQSSGKTARVELDPEILGSGKDSFLLSLQEQRNR